MERDAMWQDATEELQHERDEIAWRSVLVGAAAVVTGQLAFLFVGLHLFGPTPVTWLRVAHMALALTVFAFFAVRRRRTVTPHTVVGFYLLVLPMFPLFWAAEVELEAAGVPWTPFVGHKLVMMGLAVLMPGRVIHPTLLLAGFGALVVAQYVTFDLARQPVVVVAGEPWITLIFGGIAGLMLAFRAHQRALAHRYARWRAEAEALRATARFLIAVRDKTNTPLQTLEIDAAILERRHPESAEAIGRMRKALTELRELSRLLSRYDRVARWEQENESFDPYATMRWLERIRMDLQ